METFRKAAQGDYCVAVINEMFMDFWTLVSVSIYSFFLAQLLSGELQT